jgi:hypothetical protein
MAELAAGGQHGSRSRRKPQAESVLD